MGATWPVESCMPRIEWRLPELLDELGITRHQLAQAMTGKTATRLTTLYRMKDPKRVDLGVLAEIITALRELTGTEVGVGDVLRYVPEPS